MAIYKVNYQPFGTHLKRGFFTQVEAPDKKAARKKFNAFYGAEIKSIKKA